MQSEVKTEALQKINDNSFDSELTLLSLNEAEFKSILWVDETELIVDGILYDLVDIAKKENGRYSIRVLADKKERKILNILHANFEQNSPAKKCAQLFFQLFSQMPSANEVFGVYTNSGPVENNFTYLNHYSFLDSKKTSPPPKVSFV